MPLIIKGKSYPMPAEAPEPNLTGKEIMTIEDHFGLDGLRLMSCLSGSTPGKGYTQAKALWSLAWVAMTRAGEVLSIDDVLNDVSIDDIDVMDEEPNPTEAA